MSTSDPAAAALAARQHGLVTRRQARALGMSDAVITRRAATGRWEAVHPGVFRIAGVPRSFEQAAMAATLWAGEDSVASHPTAAGLLRLLPREPQRPHVTVPRRRAPTSDIVVVHRALSMPDVDRRVVSGISCTSAARTIIDLAGDLDDESLTALIEQARHRGLTTRTQLRGRLAELGTQGRRGAMRLHRLLRSYRSGDRALESRLEVQFARLLARSSLPRAVRQLWVVAGTNRYRLDFAWPDRRLAVECDGWYAHGNRLVWKHDRARQAQLASAGWRIIPVTWDDVRDRPNETIDLLLDAA